MSAGHVPSTALSSSLSWGAPPPWQAEPLCLAPSSTVPSSPALDSELGYLAPASGPQPAIAGC